MGKGIDLARAAAPEHAAMLDDFKDQLLIALVKRLAKERRARGPGGRTPLWFWEAA